MITTFERDSLQHFGRNLLRVFGHPVATCSNLNQKHPTCRNTSQQGSQKSVGCCAQQCCDTLRSMFDHLAGLYVFSKRPLDNVQVTIVLTCFMLGKYLGG